MAYSILFDTDILIDYLRGHPPAIKYVEAHLEQASICTISIAELFAGARNPSETLRLDDFLKSFIPHDIDAEIAKLAGSYLQKYGKSKGIGLGDAVIAATAITRNCRLVTGNVKHYPMLAAEKPPYR